jgi:hypothetical protein
VSRGGRRAGRHGGKPRGELVQAAYAIDSRDGSVALGRLLACCARGPDMRGAQSAGRWQLAGEQAPSLLFSFNVPFPFFYSRGT